MNYDFEIKAPRWQRNFFYVVGMIALAVMITLAVLYVNGKIFKDNLTDFLGWESLPAIFVISSLFGIYVWWREVFRFRDGVFTYVKPFKRSQTAKASEIAVVKTSIWGNRFLKVVFLNSNEEALISFLDDGAAFRNGKFQRALQWLNIPLRGVMHDSFIN